MKQKINQKGKVGMLNTKWQILTRRKDMNQSPNIRYIMKLTSCALKDAFDHFSSKIRMSISIGIMINVSISIISMSITTMNGSSPSSRSMCN